ncbi:hypothetical protein ACN4EG_25740 [Alkalinema pantanalense CENA528]|uniref:hypothetical protein n=1 Tax=Alkalinema pantanalense TaxID=1620705 RepID=UPI003D6F6532
MTRKTRRTLNDSLAKEFVFEAKESTKTATPKTKTATTRTAKSKRTTSTKSSNTESFDLLDTQLTKRKEGTVRITVDLTESMHRKLSIFAAKTGQKKAEIIRDLLGKVIHQVE